MILNRVVAAQWFSLTEWVGFGADYVRRAETRPMQSRPVTNSCGPKTSFWQYVVYRNRRTRAAPANFFSELLHHISTIRVVQRCAATAPSAAELLRSHYVQVHRSIQGGPNYCKFHLLDVKLI